MTQEQKYEYFSITIVNSKRKYIVKIREFRRSPLRPGVPGFPWDKEFDNLVNAISYAMEAAQKFNVRRITENFRTIHKIDKSGHWWVE